MPHNFALLVIDMQRGLCEGPGAAFDIKPLTQRINQLAKKARDVKAPVLWVHHEEAEGALQHGSAGWQLAQGLEAGPRDILVRKTTPDSFLRTGLERLLKTHDVDALVICGLQTEYCVDTTTRRALALGLPVVLVSDGHSTNDKAHLPAAQIIAHHNVTLASISSFGPRAQLVAAADVDFGA
ncbi:cysteine hydrolase family protein [Rhodoferax saidenbachensis]|uniref:Cysteine hydrolase n=1 Tax=Rhodoferax saidenbachensis TaxID=1484693 RepID=A0A1P8KG27_9BURK|nr:cysteine hydrolase family protein [Rhodoferax saidenbachensis]APW44935.1 cysteine hydrolase [Rhodoferax saidenbachensis]